MDVSLNFKHSYAELSPEFYASVEPARAPSPKLLQFNTSLAEELGFDCDLLSPAVSQQVFSGAVLPRDARPIAQAYAGHQFGHFVPQLGDGRALLLGEIVDRYGKRRDIALKGSGVTPFSRGGDGKAAVGPVLREYLLGEAMHGLGIPTTRALAAVTTGEFVMRDRHLPGAVLTRVASSHIRVGTFQYFAARGETELIKQLADYVIQRHYFEITGDPHPYLSLLRAVIERQADLVARWMLVGFIHGVMNTDNMAVSGETIDYGPCAFMEGFDPDTVFSSIDHAGRYAYDKQPAIALWNLARFAETLLPILGYENINDAVAEATAILDTFMPHFQKCWYKGAQEKLGISTRDNVDHISEADRKLIDDWFQLLTSSKADYTLAWRCLADMADGDASKLQSLFDTTVGLDSFLERWQRMQDDLSDGQLAANIRDANPIYIPRNHLVEEALSAASEDGNIKPFEDLLEAVSNPFVEETKFARFASSASVNFTANYRTFCGT